MLQINYLHIIPSNNQLHNRIYFKPFYNRNICRKLTLLLYSIPRIISWVLIMMAKNHTTIYIAGLLCGIGYSGGICALLNYCPEIGSPKIRGIFIVFNNLSIGLGFFLDAPRSFCAMQLYEYHFTLNSNYFCCNLFVVSDSPHFVKKRYQEEIEMKIRLNPSLLENVAKRKWNLKKGIQQNPKFSIQKNQFNGNCCL